MNKYVIILNKIDGENAAEKYENICGDDIMKALKKRFGRKFKRVTGSSKVKNADVIVMRGEYVQETGKVKLESRDKYCYVEIKKVGK